jgi:type II secretory pathway pseudopilin PulG
MFNNFYKNLNSKNGFTLIEVITALFIVMMGIASAYGLITQTLAAAKTASMQLTAAYLGKEGVEIVKNIRDSNYLKIYNTPGGGSWDDGLTGCLAGCKADYTFSSLSSASPSQPLNFSAANLFSYTSGDSPTIYSRVITIDPSISDILGVSVLVQWDERGRSHSITVQENIYNWWQ